jgi:hypothetical protein
MSRRVRMQEDGQAAAAAADYAGSMKVSPGFRAGKRPVTPSSSIGNTLMMGKQVTQGPTTGFGSFRGPTVSDYPSVEVILR